MLSLVKVIAGWVLALLAVVGIGIGIDGAVDGGSRTGPGNVGGLLRITGLSCPLPPGWAAGRSISFDRYIRNNVVVVPCTGSLGDGGQVCTLPQWSGPPVLAVPVAAGGRFTAALAPGKYEMLGYPCGEAAVDVTSGVMVNVFLSCVWGATGDVGPGQRVTSTTAT